MPRKLTGVLKNMFDTTKSDVQREAYIKEFKTVLGDSKVDRLRVEDIAPVLAKINVSDAPKSKMDEKVYKTFLEEFIAKQPSNKIIKRLHLPVIAAFARDVELMHVFVRSQAVDFTEVITVEGSKVRSSSPIIIAASNTDQESIKIFELLVEKEILKAPGKADVGSWMSKALSGPESVKVVMERFKKYGDKLVIDQDDLSTTILVLENFLGSPIFTDDEKRKIIDFKNELMSHLDASIEHGKVGSLVIMRLQTPVDIIADESPELRREKNESIFKYALLDKKTIKISSAGIDGIDEDFAKRVINFYELVDFMPTADREKLLKDLLSNEITNADRMLAIVADNDKFHEFARALGKDAALREEFEVFYKDKPHLQPFKELIDFEVKEIHGNRAYIRQVVIYYAESLYAGYHKFEDFLKYDDKDDLKKSTTAKRKHTETLQDRKNDNDSLGRK